MELILLFGLHLIADGFLQSRKMAKNKSKEISYLLLHCLILFWVFFLGGLLFLAPATAWWLAVLNTGIHGVIDWFLWKGYSWSVLLRNPMDPGDDPDEWKFHLALNFKYWEDKSFYSTILLDQALHYATIVALYHLI